MKAGPLRSPIRCGLWIVGILALSGFQQPDTRQLTRVVLTFPTGELFLHVDRSGVGLSYGALFPVPVLDNGRFDIDELFQQLQPRLEEVVPGDEIPVGREYGMTMLSFSDGTGEDYLFYDAALARELFDIACAGVVGRGNDDPDAVPVNNPAAREIVLRACAERRN
jgi:hypothetical protein